MHRMHGLKDGASVTNSAPLQKLKQNLPCDVSSLPHHSLKLHVLFAEVPVAIPADGDHVIKLLLRVVWG